MCVEKYQFIGKVPQLHSQSHLSIYSQQILARNRQNGQITNITLYNKKDLNFSNTQQLLWLCSQSKSWSKQTTPLITPIIDSFQTQHTVCLIRKQFPFRLQRIQGYEKDVLQSVISQIAKIVHILIKYGINVNMISISNFRMDFKLRVTFMFGVQACFQRKENEGQQAVGQIQRGCVFGRKMVQLLEGILRNCDIKVIQLYIPLLHWLKNKRISNYLQFLKYVQVPHNIEDNKKKLLIQNLIKNHNSLKLLDLSQAQLTQFSKYYKPRTNIFTFNEIYKNQGNTTNRSNHNPGIKQIVQDVSTVKKKKLSPIICSKPVLDVRSQIKKNKMKDKQKGKNKSFVDKKTTSKQHKKQRKVSQFLIED